MLKIGHRGASAYAPENTLTAFRNALELGADGVELDVHACKTGELVVIHDDTVDRTTNGKGAVAEMTFSELRTLGLLRLEDVFEALGKQAWYFVEIKHDNAAIKAAEIIMQRGAPERSWLISFRHAALREVHNAFPSLNIGASFERLSDHSVAEAAALGAKAILPHYPSFTAGHVTEAHKMGLKIIPWTVNEPADIARARGFGVDGIISDYPDRLTSEK